MMRFACETFHIQSMSSLNLTTLLEHLRHLLKLMTLWCLIEIDTSRVFCKNPEIKKNVIWNMWRILRMKFAAFCDVWPCRLVEVFRGTCCFHSCSLMMQTAGHFETTANFYLTTWHYILKDRKLYSYCCDNTDLTLCWGCYSTSHHILHNMDLWD